MNDFRDLVKQTDEELLLLTHLDEFEEKIKLIDAYTKEYNNIKKKIKDAMLKIVEGNNLDQVKWVTPKDIKITFSKGRNEELEKQMVQEFNLDRLKEKYPNIYEECLDTKEKLVTIKNGSNDRLVITLPKEN